jgi:CheY-like chemotaxis protein
VNPSLIVTEIQLPMIDGIALCDILRRDRVTANVPILVIADTREVTT